MISLQRDGWKPWSWLGRPGCVASLLFIGLTVATGALPEFTAQPQSRTNVAGTTAIFTANATNAEPLYYNWQKIEPGLANTRRISGLMSDTLAIAEARPSDAGQYMLCVSNSVGCVTSLVATLTVILPATVVVTDSKLEAVIRSTLNQPAGPLTPANLAALKSLSVSSQDIFTLNGLEWATNLTSLNLSHNYITDLAPLEGLNRLTELNVSDNRIRDLLPVAGIPGLTSLNAGQNWLTELAPLSSLTNLTSLGLYGNSPGTLAALMNLRSLRSLLLYDSGIKDLAPLAGLTQLNYLELRSNPLTNSETALIGLTNLTTLYLGSTSVSNLGFLQNLPGLTSLNLDHTHATDLSPLATLTNLSDLDISYSLPGDLGQLTTLPRLTRLYLSGNWVSNTTGLTNLVGLTALTLQHNQIANPAPLAALPQLRDLALGWNSITDLGTLTGLTNLTSLGLDGNDISNLGFAGAMPGLKTLSTRHNRLNTLTGLDGLTNISSLFSDHNNLTNVATLQNLPRLARVQLVGNLLDLSAGSATATLIQNLQTNGVSVEHLPQNQPPTLYLSSHWTIATNATSALGFFVSDDATPADQLVVTASSSNPGLIPAVSLVLSTNGNRTLTVTSAPGQTGTVTITLTATDTAGLNTNATVLVTVVAPQPVAIPDPALEGAIRLALSKPTGNLTSLDLMAMESLGLSSGGVTNLSGLEWASNLTDLQIGSNSLSSLVILQNFPRLASLQLYVSSAAELSPLATLTNLTSLTLQGGGVTNLAFLQNLSRLASLGLTGTAVTDWSPLSTLTNLTALNLTDNVITNLAFLPPLNWLAFLSLANARITGISALATLTNLSYLDLQQNRLTEIGALTNLPHLFLADVRMNVLETNTNSALAYLLNHAVIVLFDPQRSAPVFETPMEWLAAANTTSYLHFAAGDNGPSNDPPNVTINAATGGLVPGVNLTVARAPNGPLRAWILTVSPPTNFTGTSIITLTATNQVGMSTTTLLSLTTTTPIPLNENLVWQMGGSASWFGQPYVSHDGTAAAQSGSIRDLEESSLQTTITGPSTLSFWWKISSEPAFDWLEFYIDGLRHEYRISGEVNWEQVLVTIPAGTHTILWRYIKDEDWARGSDAAWLDQVVVKPDAIIALTNLSQVYDGGSHAASVATTPAGLAVGLTYNGSPVLPVNAGTYQVVGTINDPAYAGHATNTLVIAKAALTVTANNAIRAYGQTNPPFTFSYSGFINGENISQLTSTPTTTTSATTNSFAGSYPITLGGGTAQNYAFNYVPGTLTIFGGPPVITTLVVTNTTNVILTWTSVSNVTYRVQSKASFVATWSNLPPDITATNYLTSAMNNSGGRAQQLYRIMVVNDPATQLDTRPIILSLNGAGTTNLIITWSAISNQTYRVEYRPNYSAAWTNLPPDIVATNNTASTKDTATGITQRFYRIMVMP